MIRPARHAGGRPARRRAHRRRGRAHALPAQRDAVAHRQGRRLGEVREPAVHRLVQGARRAQHAAAAHARRAQARRHRHVGRQPRPGRRLSRRPARHSRHHRHAVLHAQHEGRAHARPRRARGAARRHPGRSRRRGASRWRRPRSWCSCIPTTIRASSPARARSRSRCCRTCRELDTLVVPVGGGGLIAGCAVAARGLKPELKVIGVEIGGLLGHAPAAGRRAGDGRAATPSPRASPCATSARLPLAIARALLDCVVSGRRGGDRARHRAVPRGREDGGRRRRRGRAGRAAGLSASISPAARSGWC